MGSESQFSEADKRYRMDDIIADCSKVKSKPLSAKECYFLRAAACSVPLEDALPYGNLQLKSSAGVFVTNTVKKYVKDVIEWRELTTVLLHSSKMQWSELAHLFDELGYKRSQPVVDRDLLRLLDGLSSAACEFTGEDILDQYYEAVNEVQYQSKKPKLLPDMVEQFERGVEQAVEQARGFEKASEDARNAYLKAINYSYLLLLDDPIGQIKQGVKIAQNLSMICRYADAVTLAQGLLSFGEIYLKNKEEQSKLNFVVGVAHEEAAKKLWDDHYRQVAILSYQASINWERRKNCIALYNIFDLNFQFLLAAPESRKYLAQTRIALRHFIEVVNSVPSNFYSSKIKHKLQAALEKKRKQTDDTELLKGFGIILSL